VTRSVRHLLELAAELSERKARALIEEEALRRGSDCGSP
jgi:hypothetical protein